ncbi:MAG: hypothetical protein IJ597_00200 [Synergistaceae bacterium]|nr:hypothetical protein [Synergistaceae bacterium]
MKKFLLCLAFIFSFASSAFALNEYEAHEKRFEKFYESLVKVANQISWSGEYDFQDIEFVESELFGDETVYSRAWYDDYYLLIRSYENKIWSKGYISNFSTSSEELTFTDGIKVGAPFSKVEKFFGKKHIYGNSPMMRHVAQVEESDEGGMLTFTIENGTITSISYWLLGNQTSKMRFLYDLYADLYLGEVTGEKVNVREYAPNGEVKFQVSKSKRDRLLVNVEERNKGWYYVAGRIVNNSFKSTPYYSISKQFVKIRKLTPSERKLFFSQYKK